MLKKIFTSLLVYFMFASNVYAQDVKNKSMELVTESIATRPSAIYDFEVFNISSADAKRNYRIQLAIPKVEAPGHGFPAIFMLDGNAAMASLTEVNIQKLNSIQPTALVAIGYDVETRNDPVARAFDYTPPVHINGKLIPAPAVLGKTGGGAQLFLDLLQTEIIPAVNKKISINSDKTTFWGHSYGGLFVLYTLINSPDMFKHHVAADPSVWWHNGAIEYDWDNANKKAFVGKKISILTGTKPRDRLTPYELEAKNKNFEFKDPSIILHKIIADLANNQAKLSYITYPNNGHGDMIKASLNFIFNNHNNLSSK